MTHEPFPSISATHVTKATDVLPGSEKDKTPNHDSVVIVQDDRMGFHICIVEY